MKTQQEDSFQSRNAGEQEPLKSSRTQPGSPENSSKITTSETNAEWARNMMEEMKESIRKKPDDLMLKVLLRAMEKMDAKDPTWGENETEDEDPDLDAMTEEEYLMWSRDH